MLSERKKTNNPQTLDIKSDNVGRALRWELNSRTFVCKRLFLIIAEGGHILQGNCTSTYFSGKVYSVHKNTVTLYGELF